nr:uncharacterized protein LOC119179218 [Rhipicephalus microplus]
MSALPVTFVSREETTCEYTTVSPVTRFAMTLLTPEGLLATVTAWCGSWPVIFALVAITVGGLLRVKGLTSSARQKRKRLPPGPKGVPLLGYLPFIWKPYHVAFKEISEKYWSDHQASAWNQGCCGA